MRRIFICLPILRRRDLRDENAAGTVGVRNGEGEVMSLQSRGLSLVAGGESGQKKFLRETLALFEVHNGTNLVKNLGKCR